MPYNVQIATALTANPFGFGKLMVYGIRIDSIDGELCLTLDKSRVMTYVGVYEIFKTWHKESHKLETNEIEKDSYDEWRYNYPKVEAERFKEKRANR